VERQFLHMAENMTAPAIEIPAVPLTVEGSSVLHQMMRVRWAEWRALGDLDREHIVRDAAEALAVLEAGGRRGTAVYSLLGHKGDLMFVHFRESFDELNEVQIALRRLRLFDYLEPSSSYVSMVELGLYESTQKVYNSLTEKGIQPFSPEWDAAIADTLARQKEAMRPRLYPEIPAYRYICFYPMDRRRGEQKNWYQEPLPDRARMMHEHGMIGRRYAGEVRQIITASIGFDDWEWGVDLFAEDPLVFKKLIYEMRWDEVSAVYALFGTFYVGVRCAAADLGRVLTVS
jgi:hydrogen peroxide-dependent heme synthase